MLASVTSSITSLIGDHGLYAIFVLMVIAAVLPAASELTMLYAGALAAGAFEGVRVIAFGHEIHSQGAAYVAVCLAGLAGNLVGAALGWRLPASPEPARKPEAFRLAPITWFFVAA